MNRNVGSLMKILALEFSSPQRSVAVAPGLQEDDVAAAGLRHSRGPAPEPISEVVETGLRGPDALGMVKEALRHAQIEREQIECLAVGLGPGSYTGIRSAIALAQGWELAWDGRRIKFIGLSSADCIAVQAQTEGLIGSM